MRLFISILAVFIFWGCSSETETNGDAGQLPKKIHQVQIGPQDDTFHVGPYLQHTTQSSVDISWETVSQGSTRVEYGPDENYGQSIDGESGTIHQVTIEGLEAATTYHYRACSDDRCSADLTFTSAPDKGQPFRFVVYGDTRSDPDQHAQVAESIIASKPVLVVNVGDVVADGQIKDEYKSMHFDPTRRLGQYLPVYVAVGNHEWKEWRVPTFRDYMMFPHDTDQPEFETSYSFTYGDAFFLVLDTNEPFFFPIDDNEPELWLWLKEQVASEEAQSARWRFIFHHHPPDSACYGEDWNPVVPESAIAEFVVPLARENGFHAMFVGHEHNWEYLEYEGFPVFITGGGGAGLENCSTCNRKIKESKAFACIHHHTTVDVSDKILIVQAVDTEGLVFQEHTILP
jgi:calcineurin-like phosphoesterase family protein/purple acid phosphatase-like protein